MIDRISSFLARVSSFLAHLVACGPLIVIAWGMVVGEEFRALVLLIVGACYLWGRLGRKP